MGHPFAGWRPFAGWPYEIPLTVALILALAVLVVGATTAAVLWLEAKRGRRL